MPRSSVTNLVDTHAAWIIKEVSGGSGPGYKFAELKMNSPRIVTVK